MDFKKLGAWGAFGVLLGIAMIVVFQPKQAGGLGLLLLVGILIGVVLGGIWKFAFGGNAPPGGAKDDP